MERLQNNILVIDYNILWQIFIHIIIPFFAF